MNAPLEGIPRKSVVYLVGTKTRQHRTIKDLCYKTTSVGVEAEWKLCLFDEAGDSLTICPTSRFPCQTAHDNALLMIVKTHADRLTAMNNAINCQLSV